MTGAVLVLVDEPAQLGGVLAHARPLAAALGSALELVELPGDSDPSPEVVAGVGQRIRLVAPAVRRDAPETVAAALAAVVGLRHPRALVLPSTKRSREYAARLGGLVDAPVATGLAAVKVNGDRLEVRREMLSGNALADETVDGPFAVLAVQPGEVGTAPASPPPTMEELPVDVPAASTEIVETRPKPSGGVDLEAAERIVSIGRGLRKKEDLVLVEELARRLGAVVGCTRPIAAEAGWLSDDHWIGLTGHRVKPRLYLAVGISGAVQHLVGMRDSKVVVAINQDANAPIFQQADYRVQGDLYQILPELTKLLAAG